MILISKELATSMQEKTVFFLFFQLVKPQCHYDVNLFQYLQHFMKITLQKK